MTLYAHCFWLYYKIVLYFSQVMMYNIIDIVSLKAKALTEPEQKIYETPGSIVMKKLISAILALVIAASLSLGIIEAGAVGETTGEVNVIFLVDSSRSMNKSDPDMIRLEAIKLFADLCTLGKTKIGFVLFGTEINYEQAPMPINTEEDRIAIKKKVDELTELKGSTDIGLALRHSVESFPEASENEKGRFIVFLSDGRTVITKGENSTRTLEDSEADLEKGIEEAQNAGIPIYTIGLNANGDVDEEQLRHISTKTYADDTYMTNSASDLSEILSDIYVRHTGAENLQLASFKSIGGEHDTEFDIADGSVIEANLVIMHTGVLDDIKIKDPDGKEVIFNGSQADMSVTEGYTLMKLYYPNAGKWHLLVTSPADTKVDINCILTRDFRLCPTILTSREVCAGAIVKLRAELTDPSGVKITDENVITKLFGKGVLKNEATGETQEIVLTVDENSSFYGEGSIDTDDNYTVQVSLYNSNIDIRSEITTLEHGTEAYKEPEGPLKLILICAASVILLIVIIIMIIRYMKENIRFWSGRVVITVNKAGMPSMPMPYDFAKKVPGKRKVTLLDVLKTVSDDSAIVEAVPKSVTSAIKITMTDSGDIRLTKAGGVEYSGGITLGKKIVLSNANKVTIKYADKASGSNNLMIVQYLRT